MSQPQTAQPVQAQCAWCGQHTWCIPGNLGNGTSLWICQPDYQVNSQYTGNGQILLTPPGWQRPPSLNGPAEPPYEPDLAQENKQLKLALAEMTGIKNTDQPAVTHLAVTRAVVSQWASQQARRYLESQSRQPVVLASASAVWSEPDPAYLIKGMIPDVGVGTLFGERSTWKSFLALHLLLCVVYGTGFLTYPVDRPGWCFYLLGEGQRGAGRRLRAAVASLPVPDAAPQRLAFVKIPFPLSDEGAVGDLIAQMKAMANAPAPAPAPVLAPAPGAAPVLVTPSGPAPVSLVVFDAAADFYGPGADENRTADMNPVLAACKRISRELGCFVLLIAHSGHEGDHVRGTSRFGQVWDFEAQTSRDGEKEGCGWLRVTKSKEDADGYQVPFRVVAQGGSLTVHHGHDGAAAAAAPEERVSRADAKVWHEVLAYVAEHGGSTFRRIDMGTTGRQQNKRRALDAMCRSGWVNEEDGPNNSKLYSAGSTWEWYQRMTSPDEDAEAEAPEPDGGEADAGDAELPEG